MPSHEFVTVNVFTDIRFGGNPLAVFPAAAGLTDAQMQTLAREFNYSETTLCCRRPTPATPPACASLPRPARSRLPATPTRAPATCWPPAPPVPPEHFTFEEDAGLVRVHILLGADGSPNGARVSAPHALSIGVAVPTATVAECASLEPEDIATTAHEPLVASVGLPFVIAEVASVAALSRAIPDVTAFRRAVHGIDELAGSCNLLLYARVDGDATRLRVRMFAPLAGVVEDPATGSASAALAALLTLLAPGDTVDLAYDITQGVEIGRPSRLYATARKDAEGPVLASVAGSCVGVMHGRVEV